MRLFSRAGRTGLRKRSGFIKSKRMKNASNKMRKAVPNTRGPAPDRGKKLLGIALRVSAAVLVAAAAVCGVVAAYSHATTSKYFAIEKIEIEGERMLSEAEVMRVAKLSVGANIFAVDLKESERLIGSQPWVLKADVRRHLPRTVSIRIAERNAVSLVILEAPYMVDDSGEVFKRWAPGDPTTDLILTGYSREEFAGDSEGVRESIKDAIALSRRYRSSALEKMAPLAEIHHEVDGGVSLTVGADPFYIRLGRGPYRTKLGRLETLLARIMRDGDSPAMVYFDNEIRPDRVTVKLKTTQAEEEEKVGENAGAEDGDQKRVSKI